MAILDILKKKKEKKEKEKREAKKTEEKKEEKKEKVLEKPVSPERAKRKSEAKIAPLILEAPHITEKATFLAEGNQYVFKVSPRATKPEIKKAIEEVYGVDVLKVRIIKVSRKRRRVGRTVGWRKRYKKAIVKIKEGQRIEILPR